MTAGQTARGAIQASAEAGTGGLLTDRAIRIAAVEASVRATVSTPQRRDSLQTLDPESEPMSEQRIIDVYLVAAGQFHDIDFARLELLKLLGEHENIRCKVAADYHDIGGIAAADFLVTYTCNLAPTEPEQEALRDYVASGKRWLALHGTNSILEFLENGVSSPETAPVLMQTLGTQFIAHPPIQPFKVRLADPSHELVKGIDEFESTESWDPRTALRRTPRSPRGRSCSIVVGAPTVTVTPCFCRLAVDDQTSRRSGDSSRSRTVARNRAAGAPSSAR